ncbi:hypothetical protein [Joostella sp. CR20]|uniref:hypothetical protein n=1 Tax=Joostella sp. CR20 TaxID=2804312 RepID=UPI00313E7B47
MQPKTKVFIYNMLAFVVIFLTLRFSLLYFFPEVSHLVMVIIAAVLTSVLAPKFAIAHIDGKDQIKMKWIFMKGFKDIN